MSIITRGVLFFLIIISPFSIRAQISPPGISESQAVTWVAAGINQPFGKRWSTNIYVGGSAMSDPNNFRTFQKSAIMVFNQETYYQFSSHWQLGYGLSLRYQSQYGDDPPYASANPAYKKEIRQYLRLFYRKQTGNVAWAYSFRPEYRSFYAPDGSSWSTPVEWRFRLKVQATIPINAAKTSFFVAANEWLGVTEENSSEKWSSFYFTEDRLSTYYRKVLRKPSMFVDLGVMQQFWGKDAENINGYTIYFAFDIIFQNPFGWKSPS